MNRLIWSLFVILLSVLLLKYSGEGFVAPEYLSTKGSDKTLAIQPIFKDETLAWQINARHQQSGHILMPSAQRSHQLHFPRCYTHQN